jgi:spermidine synthase
MKQEDLRYTLGGFLAGAAVMVIEMAGARLLSVWFGNSLLTWSALIGLVLVALSLGSWIGGYWIDRAPQTKTLSKIFFSASFYTLLIPFLRNTFQDFFLNAHIFWGPFGASLLLFVVPSLCLGMITPMMIKLLTLSRSEKGSGHLGGAAGLLGMWGTLGSVAGTFSTSFFLIPHFSLTQIYLGTGLCLSLLGFIFLKKEDHFSRRSLVGLFFLGISSLSLGAYYGGEQQDPRVIFEKQTFYHRIQIQEMRQSESQYQRYLILDTTLEGGRHFMGADDPKRDPLILSYTKYWKLVDLYLSQHLSQQSLEGIFLGGGAFGMPMEVCQHHPQSSIKVFELDPEVIVVARRYLGLKEDTCLQTFAGDGRRLLRTMDLPPQDFIFGDAYHGIRSVPSHMVTKEFFQLVHQQLKNDGIYLMNIISAVKGKKSLFFHSIVKTLKSVFAQVDVYLVEKNHPSEVQNIILVALKSGHDKESPQQRFDNNRDLLYEMDLESLIDHYSANAALNSDDQSKIFTDDDNSSEYILVKGLWGE